MSLSPSQVEEFHSRGFLVVRGLLPAAVLEPLIEDMEEIIENAARELHNRGKIDDTHAGAPFDRRIALLTRDSGESVQGKVSFPLNLRRPIFDFLHNGRLLDAVEGLVGEEIFCNPTHHVRPKLPESHLEEQDHYWIQLSPLHQDAAVLLPEADNTLVVTTWIPLVDCDETNGTIRVVPGLHRGALRRHVRCPYGWQIADDEMPEEEPVPIAVRKGDVVFIHCRTPHGSGPNLSGQVRWSMDLRWNDARKPHGRPLPGLLVRSKADPSVNDPATAGRRHKSWVEEWREARADTKPRRMYRWPDA